MKQLSTEQRARVRLAARHELWRRGEVALVAGPRSEGLHAGQRLIYDALESSTAKRVYLNISRRWGKSFLFLVREWEKCLKRPGWRVLYVAPSGKDAENIAVDLVAKITATCPPELVPEFSSLSKEFNFTNGSRIRFIGANNERARYARGQEVDEAVVDEAAEVDDLPYLVNEVLMPMTFDTDGRILLASTPPRSPSHPSTLLAKRLALEGGPGAYFHFTIHQNPRATPERIAAYCAEAGGPESTTWKREYLADLDTVDSDTVVVPEFAKAEASICVEWPRPPGFVHVDKLVSMDPAFVRDRSGGLFGYVDFLAGGRLVLEREFLLHRPTIAVLAKATNDMERQLWPDMKVRLRVVDDPHGVIAPELWEQGKVSFIRAEKSDRDRSISIMRQHIQAHRIYISPSGCPELVKQLKYAVWNKRASDMERTPEGHFDLVAALWLMCRHLDLSRNPYPADFGIAPHMHYVGGPPGRNPDALSKALLSGTPLGRRVLRGKR